MTFKFQHPSQGGGAGAASARINVGSPGSRATSIKAEPSGSALESNASASGGMIDKLLSPAAMGGKVGTGGGGGVHGHPGQRLQAVKGEVVGEPMSDGSTSSSLYSLLKSSDDFGPTGESSYSISDEDKVSVRKRFRKINGHHDAW